MLQAVRSMISDASISPSERELAVATLHPPDAEIQRHLVANGKVLIKFTEHNVTLNPKKCNILKKQVKFTGQQISLNKREMDPSRVQAFADWPLPKTFSKLSNFVHVLTYFSDWIENCVAILQPLREIMTQGSKSQPIKWTAQGIAAFETAKAAACKIPTRHSIDPSKKLFIMTDGATGSQNGDKTASGGISAVLYQLSIDDDYSSKVLPIAFFSRKLTSAQNKWSPLDVELLAICAAVTRWFKEIAAAPVYVRTDHKNILAIVRNMMHSSLSRTSRMVQFLAQHDIIFDHVKGKDNFTDGLSRNQEEEEEENISSASLIKIINSLNSPSYSQAVAIQSISLTEEFLDVLLEEAEEAQDILDSRDLCSPCSSSGVISAIHVETTANNVAQKKYAILCDSKFCNQWTYTDAASYDRYQRRPQGTPFFCRSFVDGECKEEPPDWYDDEELDPEVKETEINPRPAATRELKFTRQEILRSLHNGHVGHLKNNTFTRRSTSAFLKPKSQEKSPTLLSIPAYSVKSTIAMLARRTLIQVAPLQPTMASSSTG